MSDPIVKQITDKLYGPDEPEPRYWVNHDGPSIHIVTDYGDSQIVNDDWVGLVDNEAGGMIAYGHPNVLEELAKELNHGR